MMELVQELVAAIIANKQVEIIVIFEPDLNRLAMTEEQLIDFENVQAGQAGGWMGAACLGHQDQAAVRDRRRQWGNTRNPAGTGGPGDLCQIFTCWNFTWIILKRAHSTDHRDQ